LQQYVILNLKSRHRTPKSFLLSSVTLALSQTPVYTARLQIWIQSQCIARCACLRSILYC